jgi:hypothetical protein
MAPLHVDNQCKSLQYLFAEQMRRVTSLFFALLLAMEEKSSAKVIEARKKERKK